MAFRQGAVATVWDVEDRESYAIVEISTSKRKQEGGYETDFSNKFVKFIGEAHKAVIDKQSKDKIRLGECAVTTYKGKDGQWRNSFAVFTASELEDKPISNNEKKDEGKLPY